MKKKMLTLLKIIISISIAYIFSRCLFDSSLVVTVCIFYYILGISSGDLEGLSVKLSTKKKVFLTILVGIGTILVALGKVVFHNEIMIIIGAMFVALEALIIVSVVSDIVDKVKAG